jgi:hypothetical protein
MAVKCFITSGPVKTSVEIAGKEKSLESFLPQRFSDNNLGSLASLVVFPLGVELRLTLKY